VDDTIDQATSLLTNPLFGFAGFTRGVAAQRIQNSLKDSESVLASLLYSASNSQTKKRLGSGGLLGTGALFGAIGDLPRSIGYDELLASHACY